MVTEIGTPPPPLRQALTQLCERFGLADLYVFGSRAEQIAARLRGEVAPGAPAGPASDLDAPGTPPRPESDVDVGVRALPGRRLGVDDLVDIAAGLEALFEVPRVDVVNLPTAGAFLALEVIRGELLFCADRHDQDEFELYVLRRAGDLLPFQRQRETLALSRYLDQ